MKTFLFLSCLFLFPLFVLTAQDADLINVERDNLDSVFDEPHLEEAAPPEQSSVLQQIRKRGIEFNASYNFKGALNPGWDVYPWELDDNEHFSWAIGIEMGSSMEVIAQISESFRVRSVISYSIPDFNFSLGDFFFDYNFLDKVFLRAGKFEQGWGVSPNFGFTNLLSRIPSRIDGFVPAQGSSYMMKLDVPVGIGGLQMLVLTRAGEHPSREYFGYGGKFNLAFNWADFNLGVFYQDYMATRSFLSVKTNLFKTDIYNEWLLAYNNHTDNSVKFAFNIGLTKSFFDNKLEINAEYFYNGEEATFYYRPESDFREEESLPFIKGHNFAFNLLFRLGGNLNPRLFTRLLYGDESVSLVAGFRINPFPNMELYFAIPMVFGNKEGHYYENSFNILNQHRPFSLILYVSFNGGVRVSHYY